MEAVGVIAGLAGAGVSALTFVVLVIRGVFSVEKRLTRLETQMEPFADGLRQLVVDALTTIKPPGNPIGTERYQDLLGKLKTNALRHEEAQELNTALIELRAQANEAMTSRCYWLLA